MKVIYLISFPPAYHYCEKTTPDHYWINKKGEQIGVWRTDWGHIIAEQVKRFFPEIEFEVWRPDYRAEKEYYCRFADGVIHRSFPAQKKLFFYGAQPIRYCSSRQMLIAIRALINENKVQKDVLIHIPVDFSYIGHVVLKKYSSKIPFLHTSHLNHNLLDIQIANKNILKKLHRLLILRLLNNYRKRLTEIASPSNSIGFFKSNSSANVYLFNTMNFDINWAKSKISKEKAREILGLPKGKKIILSSSRIVPEKQIDKLIKAMSEVKKDFILLISGSGEASYIKKLTKMVLDVCLSEKIKFTGYIDKQLIYYYSAADIFISTSASEGGPVSVYKAIMLGLPVIATNTGMASYLLKEHDAGIILDKNDFSGWSKAIDRALNEMPNRIIDMKSLEAEYRDDVVTANLVNCYRRSLENYHQKQFSAIQYPNAH